MADAVMDGERADGNSDFWGFVYQRNAYEGLACDALEWIASAGGGTIISPDSVITVNNDAAAGILEQMAAGVGTISPIGVLGFDEEAARNMWEAGNALFMRNWPYAYALGHEEGSAVAGKFDVAPLPAGDGGTPAATLGGWQLGVSAYSNNKELAADVALFMTSYDEQKRRAIAGSYNPTIMALYEDDEVLEAVPFFGSLYDVFINAVARPSTATAPQYATVSQSFYRAVHSVLSGDEDAATALALLELDLEAITGFETGAP